MFWTKKDKITYKTHIFRFFSHQNWFYVPFFFKAEYVWIIMCKFQLNQIIFDKISVFLQANGSFYAKNPRRPPFEETQWG